MQALSGQWWTDGIRDTMQADAGSARAVERDRARATWNRLE
ncbi:hypothetical protein [Nocardia sp. NPDC059239]